MILWELFADLVLVIHVVWTLAIILAPLVIWKSHKYPVIHLWMMWIGLIALVGFDYCPLSMLESWLRLRYDPGAPYPGRFFLSVQFERMSNLSVNTGFVLGLFVFWIFFWSLVYYLRRPAEAPTPTPASPEPDRPS